MQAPVEKHCPRSRNRCWLLAALRGGGGTAEAASLPPALTCGLAWQPAPRSPGATRLQSPGSSSRWPQVLPTVAPVQPPPWWWPLPASGRIVRGAAFGGVRPWPRPAHASHQQLGAAPAVLPAPPGPRSQPLSPCGNPMGLPVVVGGHLKQPLPVPPPGGCPLPAAPPSCLARGRLWVLRALPVAGASRGGWGAPRSRGAGSGGARGRWRLEIPLP